MFDLPVVLESDRKAANDFRNWLLDHGYERAQLSVYSRFCVGKEQLNRRIREVSNAVPDKGTVHILAVTEKQFQQAVILKGAVRRPGKRSPGQFDLF